jgi:hypothetical protein
MRFCSLVPLGALLFLNPCPAQTPPSEPANRPHIFQYVSPFREGNADYSSVMALSPEQMTVDEGENPLFDGITLIIPWSLLEPKEGQIDFSILDGPLDYWGKKGKQVVFNIAPIIFPTVVGQAWGGKLIGGAPDWVMQQCETHVVQARILDYPHGDKVGPYAFPTPWDPKFEQAYFDFIAQLGKKYDGDPRLAAVRIGTGTEGEENPIFRQGRQNTYTGFTYEKWYGYCRDTVKAHVAAFTKTPLECDLTFAGVVYKESPEGRAEVEKLIDVMKEDHVALGFNGFSGKDPVIRNQSSGINDMLLDYHDAGCPIALEAGAAPQNPVMWNTARMLDACQRLKPVRVNFMGNVAALVNWDEGINDPRDGVALRQFKHAVTSFHGDPADIAKKFHEFIVAVRQIDLSGAPTQ